MLSQTSSGITAVVDGRRLKKVEIFVDDVEPSAESERCHRLCSSNSPDPDPVEPKIIPRKRRVERAQAELFDKLLRCQRLSATRLPEQGDKVVICEAESTNPAQPGRHLETALQKVLRKCADD